MIADMLQQGTAGYRCSQQTCQRTHPAFLLAPGEVTSIAVTSEDTCAGAGAVPADVEVVAEALAGVQEVVQQKYRTLVQLAAQGSVQPAQHSSRVCGRLFSLMDVFASYLATAWLALGQIVELGSSAALARLSISTAAHDRQFAGHRRRLHTCT